MKLPIILKAIGLAGLFAMPALADDDMSGAYNNTIAFDSPVGPVELYLNADGSHSNNQGGSGTWRMSDGRLCLTAGTAQESCTPMEAGHQAGETWSQPNPFGAMITYQIIEGREN